MVVVREVIDYTIYFNDSLKQRVVREIYGYDLFYW